MKKVSLIRKDLFFLTTNTLKVKKKKIHTNIFIQVGTQGKLQSLG